MAEARKAVPALALVALGICIFFTTYSLLDEGDKKAILEEDAALSETLKLAQQAEHDPAVVEARALQAVLQTKKAALALQTARQAVVRFHDLGDAKAVAAALRAEQYSKKTFLKAREVSTPLVAEARANYAATQGTEIQKIAREVAQDTWRSMTGSPLRPGHFATVEDEEGLRYGSLKAQIRRAAIEKVKRRVANDYREQAHTAQQNAIAAQRQIDALGPDAATHVAVIAKYADSAKRALAATEDAKTKAEASKARMLKAETDEKKKKQEEKAAPKASKTAEETINQARYDVAAAMQTVENAANERGMADHSWHARVGDLVRSGQPNAAHEAASQYVTKRIKQAVSKEVKKDPTADAQKEVADAQKAIDDAAARHK